MASDVFRADSKEGVTVKLCRELTAVMWRLRLKMTLRYPIIRGMSLLHCHLLSHEDKGMMAKILFR